MKRTKLSPIKESKRIQLEYLRELRKLANSLKKQVREKIIPMLKTSQVTEVTTDSVSSIIAQLELLRNDMLNVTPFADRVSKEVVESVNTNSKNKFLAGVNAAVGVNLTRVLKEENLTDIVALQRQKNKVLIKSIPEEFLKGVEITVQNGLAQGLRPEAIAKQLNGIKGISSVFGKLDNRVKMIARNEISTINANINKARFQNLGIKIYQWKTAQDDRVRPDHNVMNNKYCKFEDDSVYADSLKDAKAGKWKKRASIGGVQLGTGIDFNCRCASIAIIEDE